MAYERLQKVKYAGICTDMRGVRHFWRKVPENRETRLELTFLLGGAAGRPTARSQGKNSGYAVDEKLWRSSPPTIAFRHKSVFVPDLGDGGYSSSSLGFHPGRSRAVPAIANDSTW